MTFDIAFIVVTIFWLLIGGVLPFIIPRGSQRGLIQTMLVVTAVCCYLFWLIMILAQKNPLIGPQLHNLTMAIMLREWDRI